MSACRFPEPIGANDDRKLIFFVNTAEICTAIYYAKKGVNMTIEQIIEREMTLRTERFWGRDYEDFAPILANKRHGDGNRLMWFTPMSTRPNFYSSALIPVYPVMAMTRATTYYAIL
jgi:hypothetical protein